MHSTNGRLSYQNSGSDIALMSSASSILQDYKYPIIRLTLIPIILDISFMFTIILRNILQTEHMYFVLLRLPCLVLIACALQ